MAQRDGSNFTKIAYVAGAGNTALPQQYKYQDKIKLTNIQYYRLKQVDQDQRFVYSNTVVLRSNESGELQLLSVTNPFFSSVNMMFSKPPVGIMQIRIIDMNGRQLYSTTRMPGNTSIVEFGIPAVLSSGSYVLQVEAGGQQFSKIIVKK